MVADVIISSRANIARFQDRSCHLIASLEIEMSRARRYERPLSLLSIEVRSLRGAASDSKSFRQLSLEKRLRKLAPTFLRLPDFWGRIERLGFVMVLPETPVAGAEGAVRRLVEHELFQLTLTEEAGRADIRFGAAEMDDQIMSVDDFVRKAQTNLIWSSSDDGDAPLAGGEAGETVEL